MITSSQLADMHEGAWTRTASGEADPTRRAQLKLQGSYLGFMRQLGPRQKARVKAVKEKRGFEAAIGVARSITGG